MAIEFAFLLPIAVGALIVVSDMYDEENKDLVIPAVSLSIDLYIAAFVLSVSIRSH
jgi:hypothetical protein